MVIKKTKNNIVSDTIIEKILSDIEKGRLKPGEKLDGQRTLAKKYNVGMSSIREALSALSMIIRGVAPRIHLILKKRYQVIQNSI